MCHDSFILVLDKIQRYLPGMFPGIFQQKHTDLIQQDKSRTLYAKANKEGQHSSYNHDYGRIYVIAPFDGRDRLHDNVVAGKHRSKNQQNDSYEIRHVDNQ